MVDEIAQPPGFGRGMHTARREPKQSEGKDVLQPVSQHKYGDGVPDQAQDEAEFVRYSVLPFAGIDPPWDGNDQGDEKRRTEQDKAVPYIFPNVAINRSTIIIKAKISTQKFTYPPKILLVDRQVQAEEMLLFVRYPDLLFRHPYA